MIGGDKEKGNLGVVGGEGVKEGLDKMEKGWGMGEKRRGEDMEKIRRVRGEKECWEEKDRVGMMVIVMGVWIIIGCVLVLIFRG